MIHNLIEEVEGIVKSTLASHVSKDDDLTFSVMTFSETHIEMTETGPSIHQHQCLGIWLLLDTPDNTIATVWSCSLNDYTKEILQEELVVVWDALVVQRMEQDLRLS